MFTIGGYRVLRGWIMSLLDDPGHYGHSPVPYTILGALKTSGPTTASSSSMVNMGLLGEVKHRNTVIIVCTCVLQCIGVDVYTELQCILYIRCQGRVHFTQTYIDTVYYDHLCCIGWPSGCAQAIPKELVESACRLSSSSSTARTQHSQAHTQACTAHSHAHSHTHTHTAQCNRWEL